MISVSEYAKKKVYNLLITLHAAVPDSPENVWESINEKQFEFHEVLFTPTHALLHTTMYQSFKLY